MHNPEKLIESNADYSWQGYLNNMSCQGTWADAIIIQAIANCLNSSLKSSPEQRANCLICLLLTERYQSQKPKSVYNASTAKYIQNISKSTDFQTASALNSIQNFRQPLHICASKVYFPGGGGVLREKLGGGVRPTSQNPYLTSDQNLRFSLPYFRPDQNLIPHFRPFRSASVQKAEEPGA